MFSDGRPRIIQVRDIDMEFELAPPMLFIRNADKPGFIGRLGTLMGEAGVNIATCNLGRDNPGGDAICMVAVDVPVPTRCWPRSAPCPTWCASTGWSSDEGAGVRLSGSDPSPHGAQRCASFTGSDPQGLTPNPIRKR